MTAIVDAFPHNVICLDPVFIPMPDGKQLAATIWLPDDADTHPVPAIIELIPYRRRDGTVWRDFNMHPYLAGHGFACCRIDIRGSGDSEGVLCDEYTEQEQDDACAIIAWVAEQSWCTGNVGMTGISWGGFNSLQVAARQPPALKAIIALCCSDDRYADDVHYFGGCLLTEDAMWSSFMLAISALPPDPQIVGDKWRDMWLERLNATTCWSEHWMAHQRRDAYWKRGSVCEDFSKITIPVYAVSGWDDTYSNSVPRLLSGLNGPKKGLIGPWTHSFPFMEEPGPAIGFLQEAIRWWNHWLKGQPTGIMDEPQYAAWLTEPHAPAPFYPDHPGRFVGEPSWPSPNSIWDRYSLNSSGLGTAPEAGNTMLLRSPVNAGRDCGRYGGYGGEVPDMAIDQRREDGLGLCFDTEVLTESFSILGAPTVELTLSCDTPDAFIVGRLCDVAPDGTSTLVTWGVLNLAHRYSFEHPQKLVPGEIISAKLVLNDIGRRFPAGHKLRLVLSNQHWPVLWPSPQCPTFTIESGACQLLLPRLDVADGERLVTFGPAEMAPHVQSESLAPDGHSRTLTIDGATLREKLELIGDYGQQFLPDRNITIASRSLDIMEIAGDDPLSAKIATGWDYAYQSGEADVTTRSSVTLTSDATRFHLQWSLEVQEQGKPFFSKEGSQWFDRDHL